MDGLLIRMIPDRKPINDAVQAAADTLQDHVYDHYLNLVTPWVFKDLQSYYGLSEEDVIGAFTRMSEQPLAEVSQSDKLIEQAFVMGQVDYIRKILTVTLAQL